MRGGTIPGTVHMAHFRPLIERLWGPSWYRTGSLSLYYTYASTHREDVRAVVRDPADAGGDSQLECWVEIVLTTFISGDGELLGAVGMRS